MSEPEPNTDPYGYHDRTDPYANGAYQYPAGQPWPPPPPAIPYAQQPYQAPYPYPYPPVAPKPPTSTAAIVSLVFGLLSIFFWWLVFPPLLALLTGFYGMYEAVKRKKGGAGMAIVGLVIGAIGTLIWGGFLISELLGNN